MPSTTVYEKAARLIATDRVHRLGTTGEWDSFVVDGDHGLYRVSVNTAYNLHRCTCPWGLYHADGICSHIVAALGVST